MLRYSIYLDLRNFRTVFGNLSIDNEIVLYASEILMGILIIYMLSSMNFGGDN